MADERKLKWHPPGQRPGFFASTLLADLGGVGLNTETNGVVLFIRPPDHPDKNDCHRFEINRADAEMLHKALGQILRDTSGGI